jgi:hypothetical protein
MAQRKDTGMMIIAGTLASLGVYILVKAIQGEGSAVISSRIFNSAPATPEASMFSAIAIIVVGLYVFYKA